MSAELSRVLPREAVRLAQHATDKWDVLRQCGAVLTEIGAVSAEYTELMVERETMISTYVGEGVAIPHGTNAARSLVHHTALGFLQFPDGVDWDGERMFVAVPIAAAGGEHLELLSALAMALLDPDRVARLRSAASPEDVLAALAEQPADPSGDAGDDSIPSVPGGADTTRSSA